MPKCLFERATGLFVSGTSFDDLPHDNLTHVQLVLPRYPDRRTERWDGALGVRPATPAELAAGDQAAADSTATLDVNQKIIKAVLIYLVQRLNELRATPVQVLPALTQQDVLAGVLAIYKGL